jgi:hypothetical protein
MATSAFLLWFCSEEGDAAMSSPSSILAVFFFAYDLVH